jgi:hypothetical protein
MPPAVALAGAAVAGSVVQGIAGSKAAKAQVKGQEAAIAEQRRQYDQTREDFAPWRNTGQSALSVLANVYGLNSNGTGSTGATAPDYSAFYQSPDYTFRRDQGLQAIDRSNAARGWLNSGAADKQRMRYGSDLAAGEFGNWFNRMAGIAGVGQAAAGSTAQAGMNAANNISNAQTNIGNANASSYANWGSAANSGINNVLFSYFNQGKS